MQVDGDQSAAPAGAGGDAATTSTPPTTTEDPNAGAAGDPGSLKVIHHANTTYLYFQHCFCNPLFLHLLST